MQNEMVRLRIVGITYNQIENGMYALVLEEEGGVLRLPIIIGYSEAQAIECMLQNIKTPRPLTHEFASRILSAFRLKIDSVVVKQMPNGVFSADVTISNSDESHVIDARSSDAIAMAMRGDAPIFTSRALLERCGIQISDNGVKIKHTGEPLRGKGISSGGGLRMKTGDELNKMMAEAVAAEDYEKAAEIKKEIDKRLTEEEI